MSELVLAGFPPISPRLPAVDRSLARIPGILTTDNVLHVARTAISQFSTDHTVNASVTDGATSTKVLDNLPGVDVVSVLPVLVPPNEPSRSPVARRSNQTTPERDVAVIENPPLGSSPPTIDHLAADLAKAQSELAAVRLEYTQLRDFASEFLLKAGVDDIAPSMSSVSARTTGVVSDRGADAGKTQMYSRAVTANTNTRTGAQPQSHTNETFTMPFEGGPSFLSRREAMTPDSGTSQDALEEMSGDEAKQKLKASAQPHSTIKCACTHILAITVYVSGHSYFSLPSPICPCLYSSNQFST